MTQIIHPLWDYLDTCGIEFRLTKAQLVEKYGRRNSGWTTNLDYCEVDSPKPFIEGLAHPIIFQYTPGTDMELPPTWFAGYVRQFDDCDANFNFAYDQVQKIFGKGEDNSVSNTMGRKWNFADAKAQWQFGDTSVSLTTFPVNLNKRANGRHKVIPGSKTECSVRIETAYCREPNKQERQWLETYERYYTPPGDRARSNHYITGLTRAWPNDLEARRASFGFSQDGAALIALQREGFVEILLTKHITSVSRFSLTPARGGGGAYLSVNYTTPRGVPQNVTLASTYAAPKAYKSLSERLAEKLGVPLESSEQPDC